MRVVLLVSSLSLLVGVLAVGTSAQASTADASGSQRHRHHHKHHKHHELRHHGAARWLSGVSGDGATDGRFAAWRGRPVQIVGTWNDDEQAQINQWTLAPGFGLGSWQGSVDDAVGAIYKNQGETWAAAANGAYDARWTRALTSIRTSWGDRPGTVYIRFAHEFNGDWEPWSVTGAEVPAFKRAWTRFRSLQRAIFPQSKLVLCPSSETSSSLGLDWRQAFPGRSQVDVLGVDYYNQWPYVRTARQFAPAIMARDQHGAPRGLERYRRFAASHGVPMAISEWSSNAQFGDSPAFVRQLHRWLTRYGGTGPGRVLYEIEFNVGGYGNNFHLYPSTRQPRTSSAYRRLW